MISKQLFFNLLWRTILPLATGTFFVWLAFNILNEEILFTLLTGLILVSLEVWFLTRYVSGINRLLVEFVETVGREHSESIFIRERGSFSPRLARQLNKMKKEMLRARMELERQERLMSIVLDAMDTSLICQQRNGSLLFMNEAANRLFRVRSAHHLDDLKQNYPELVKSMEKTRTGTPVIFKHADSRLSIRCKDFGSGDREYRLFSLQDMRQETEIQEIESWQKLIRVMNHEIMNSIGPIISLSRSLKQSIGLPEKLETGLDTIQSTGKGLIRFIEQYRELSTLPPPELKSFTLNDLFSHLEELFSDDCHRLNIQLQVEIATGTITADRQQLEQVMVNLVRNAIESLQESDERIIRISSDSGHGRTKIMIEDTGPGIAENDRDKIFIPFFTTKKQGSGIGLSISRQIINNHHGTLEFELSSSGGPVFTITI